MRRNFLLFLLLSVLSVTSSFAQENSNPSPQKVKFLIKAVSGSDDKEKGNGKLVFRVGEKILIKTLLKNESNEPLVIAKMSQLFQYRFEIWEIGKPGVRWFRRDKALVISQRDNDEGSTSVYLMRPIPPGKSKELETIDLEEIYERLEPGKYKLRVYFRPMGGGYGNKKIPSNPLMIEIVS